MTKVVTYSAPGGGEISLTRSQTRTLERAHVWPRNERGEEYCQVSYGLHTGEPTYSDDQIALMCRELR